MDFLPDLGRKAVSAAMAGVAGGVVRWLTLRDQLWPTFSVQSLAALFCLLMIALKWARHSKASI